jgi:hypothetical protein
VYTKRSLYASQFVIFKTVNDLQIPCLVNLACMIMQLWKNITWLHSKLDRFCSGFCVARKIKCAWKQCFNGRHKDHPMHHKASEWSPSLEQRRKKGKRGGVTQNGETMTQCGGITWSNGWKRYRTTDHL